MDLQVVVWLFYCFLLPATLLTGRRCNLCVDIKQPVTSNICWLVESSFQLDPPLSVLTLLVTHPLGANCSSSWRRNCKTRRRIHLATNT